MENYLKKNLLEEYKCKKNRNPVEKKEEKKQERKRKRKAVGGEPKISLKWFASLS